MEVNKLSEELKICLDAGCHNCAYHKAQKVAVCKKLLERAFIVARSREHFEENERHLAPGGKVYAADSSLGVLEYTVDKRISTKESLISGNAVKYFLWNPKEQKEHWRK